MNFDLTEDQQLLKSLAERFVQDSYDVEKRRGYIALDDGFSRANWAMLAELGILAAAMPEDAGGLGLDLTSLAVIAEALGHGLVVEPVVESAFLIAPLFAQCASADLRARMVDGLMSGERRLALAHWERGSRAGSTWIECQAEKQGDGFVLNGAKPYVACGGYADGYIVSAQPSGNDPKAPNFELYFVPASTEGLARREWRLADGTSAAELVFTDVVVDASDVLQGGAAALARSEQWGAALKSAEALGIMERLFADTLDYIRQREQFGQPIGTFQAIQHRMVAQYAALEQSRALLELALVSEGTEDFAKAVQGARAFIAAASVELGHEAIQFHGGIGVTDELAIGQGHKRMLVLSRWGDNAEAALDAYAGAR